MLKNRDDMGDKEEGISDCKVASCCGIFWTVLILILTSLSQVQFNEYAFAKPWGSSIDQSHVYEQGVHMMGFWTSLITFPADIVNLRLENLEVFSKNDGENTAGTTLDVTIDVQYKLDPKHLSELFDIGGQKGYITQIEAESVNIVKNTATQFEADSYLTKRREIEETFQEVLTEVIFEKFAQTQVVNVQFLSVVFPDAFYSRKLDVGLQEIKNEIENFTRQTTQVRAKTASDVLKIENQAQLIVDSATANATLLTSKASNTFESTIAQAKENGMLNLLDTLGITNQSQKMSLNYLVQILNNPSGQKKFVNFGELPRATSLV